MPTIPQTLNGLRALSVRFWIPWRGAWLADVEVDADVVETIVTSLNVPSPGVLISGGKTLTCTIDPRYSGTFQNRAHARVVGGRGGWDTEVPAQDFVNPAGPLPSTVVYAATGALVLETVADPIPQIFDKRFPRSRGPASRVFRDRDWFVDPVTGITTVAQWPPAIPDPEWTIADFDIGQKRITILSDNLILPGTVIVDPRFNGQTFIARDVEQTFDANGGRAEVWVAEKPVSRLAEGLASLVRELAGTAALKMYRYRFVLPEPGGMLALQAITPGAPDLNPISQWTGLSGISASLVKNATLAPATELVVGFTADDPPAPFIAAFSPLAKPLGLSLDAVTFINVGAATSPVALSIGVLQALAALKVEIDAIAAALVAAGSVPTWTVAGPAMGAAAGTALTGGTAAFVPALALIPSKKLLSE